MFPAPQAAQTPDAVAAISTVTDSLPLDAKGDVTRDIIGAPEGDGREAQTSVGGN